MTSRTRTVFRKELRETFRDKRVILGVIVSPLLVTPLLIVVMGFFLSKKVTSDKSEQLPVGVVNLQAISDLAKAIGEFDTLEVSEVADRAAAETAVRDRRLRAVMVVPDDAGTSLEADGRVTIEILFDGASDKSRNAVSRLEGIVRRARDSEVDRRLANLGVNREILKPLESVTRDLAPEEKVGGFILGTILPYIVILSAAFGGMTTAFDLCAGEKERGTMETLLVSPATRHEIILGKLATIAAISVLAALCAITGLVLAMQGGFAAAKALMDADLSISYPAVGAMLLIVIPLALMTSSLLLVISTFARNQKEAQAYVFPFMIIIMLPAVLSSILGPEGSFGISLVPILNTALVMKQVLAGTFDLPFLAVALLSSALYAGAAMRLAVSMFERESILFRA